MNGDMFEKWLKERLIPTFKARYPGKRMYLVMDNAPYHHAHPDDSFFARNHTKEEIQSKLAELDVVDEITVNPFSEGAPWIEPPEADAPIQDFES